MTIALQFCHITVNDVDDSIAFYGDALGLKVRNDVSSGEYRWVTLGGDGPGAEIVLSVPHAGRRERPRRHDRALSRILCGARWAR